MIPRRFISLWVSALATIVTVPAGWAQFSISGVNDRQTYTDSVVFQVVPQAGYNYTAYLNTNAIPVGQAIEVRTMDYYELLVTATPSGGGTPTSSLTRFIVLSSNRGSPEKGLIEWTPYPVITSTAAEFAGAQLRILAPQDYPPGLEIPVVAWVLNDDGNARRVNGTVSAPGFESGRFVLRRGVGSGFLPAAADGSSLSYNAQVASLQTNKAIQIDSNVVWTNVSGTLAGATVWPENSRIHVVGHLTVPSGSSLTIGAGTIVLLNPMVNITNSGSCSIEGTLERPVVFTATNHVVPEQHTYPWGGFVMRGALAQLRAHGAIFVGGGGASSFSFSPGSSHRSEQAVFLVHSGASARLTNCAVLNTAGQVGNGYECEVIYDKCLFQRAITAGEYEGGVHIVNHSALIEFPEANGEVNAQIADADYDAIYFTTGTHVLMNSLIGFSKDDAIDCGSGDSGTVLVSNCWVEAALHEALAWSGGGRTTWTYDTVLINNGQGIECGWSSGGGTSPACYASNLLTSANSVGARFGDNYDWTYNGFLQVSNSYILYNYRDIFGRDWADWAYRVGQMNLHDNYVTSVNTNHPNNALWDPAADGGALAGFTTTPADAPVGIGLATWGNSFAIADVTNGVPVRLSNFSTNFVSVEYAVDSADATLTSGMLTFAPGETLKRIPIAVAQPQNYDALRVTLRNPVHGEVTSPSQVWFVTGGGVARGETTLIPLGSQWKYLDNGSNQGTPWREIIFNDSGWSSGFAQLGYGEGDEATILNYGGVSNNKYITYYFRHAFTATNSGYTNLLVRLRRDDGAIVYLNGTEVFRSNIPGGTVDYLTRANNDSNDGKALHEMSVNPSLLVDGTNLVAVEVHQDSPTSSDVSFDLELVGQFADLGWQPFGDDLLFLWDAPGFILEEADAITGPWSEVAEMGPLTISTTNSAHFYRLRQR